MSACAFHNVAKSYRSDFLFRRTLVLKDISFEVASGETFAYLGHNGAGKTTTIKALLGLIRVDQGEVSLFGQPLTKRSVLGRVGYLPENPYFYDHLTGRELLTLVGDLHGLDRRTARQRTGEVLELVDMTPKADLRLRSYSKGMLQRIGLAQALMGDPDLLVLDEPMGGLDPVGRYQIRTILARLREEGKALFLSSHILADIESIADRAAIIRGGQLRRIVDLNDLRYQSRSMEIQCRHLPAEFAEQLAASGLTVSARGEAHHVVVPSQDALPSLLQEIVDTGARVLQVAPFRVSLEEIFLREVKGTHTGQTAGEEDSSVHETADMVHTLSNSSSHLVENDVQPAEVLR